MARLLSAVGSAEFDLSLPTEVRQLLALTGSDYELERQTRYALNVRYFKNTAYENSFLAADNADNASVVQRNKQLWNGIKPLYSIVNHAVLTDRELCFKGARPLPVKKRRTPRNEALEERLTSKWERYGWNESIKFSPFFGAMFGDSFMRVIPGIVDGDPKAPSRLYVYSPEAMTVLRDQHHHHRIIAAKIEYQYTEPRDELGVMSNSTMAGGLYSGLSDINVSQIVGLGNEQLHRYTMIITENAYYTFRDHARFAFQGNPVSNLSGKPLDAWDNTLGIVPVTAIPFIDIQEDMGLTTFDAILPTVDAVNELYSMLGQTLKMHADPVLIAYGFNSNAKFEKVLNPDGSTVWYVPFPVQFTGVPNPNQPKLEFLTWDGESIAPMVEFTEKIVEKAAAVLPESLYQAKSQRQGSGYEASLDMQPLVDKIEGIREPHFGAAERTIQIALVADDVGGLDVTTEEMLDRLDEARSEYDLFIWSEPVLPRDRATDSQIRSVDLADGVISERTARLERGMTYIEADEEEAQLEIEFQRKLDQARKMAEITGKFEIQTAGRNGNNGTQKGAGGRPTPPTKQGQPNQVNPRGGTQPNRRPNSPNDN